MILGGSEIQQVVAPAAALWEQVWAFVQEQLGLLPQWARAGLVVFAIVAAIASRWILPAAAELTRAKRGRA